MGSLAAKTILRAYGWWLTIRCKMGSSRSSRTQPMLEVPGRPKYVGKGSFVSGAWAAALVKGCQMPARDRERMRPPPSSGGRRRTSLQGGNRGPCPGGRGGPQHYGDWRAPGGGDAGNEAHWKRVGVGAGGSDRRGEGVLAALMQGPGAARGSVDPSGLERWPVAKPPNVGSRLVVQVHAAACAGGGARMWGPRTSVSRICIGAPQSGQT